MQSSEILVFLSLNDRGGAEISSLKLAQGLVQRGRKVTLAVYGAKPELAREFGFSGEIIDLRTRRTAGALLPLIRLLRARRFGTMISALTHTNIAAIAAAGLGGGNSRVLATEHGNDGLVGCAASPLFAFITRRAYRRATIVTVSQGLAQGWRKILPPQAEIVTIYNPAIPDFLPAPPPPAHVWLTDKTTPVIIGIGRLKDEKNFTLLLCAFAKLAAHRAARLVILGEGEQRARLETLARDFGLADKILLPRFVADTDAWLAHADLFVSASKREGFGNAIVEALARGVPVVATDCPYGPAEILEGGRYGRLVPVDDADALATAMRQSLSAPRDTQSGPNRAMNFTASRCIDAYIRLIDKP